MSLSIAALCDLVFDTFLAAMGIKPESTSASPQSVLPQSE